MTKNSWDDYAWLANFWDVLFPADEVWRVYVPTNVLALDGSAEVLLRERLGNRAEWRYVRAWAKDAETPIAEMSGRNVLFVGRTRPFHASRVAPYAYHLETKLRALFIDGPHGTRGRSIRYGDRVFESEEIRVPPLNGWCLVDYAVLSFCRGDVGFEDRNLMSVGGVSSLATWCMMRILTDDERRAELVKDVRAVAPWQPGMKPEKGFELCVRFAFENEKSLDDVLNQGKFDARVEVVALSGGDLIFREDAVEIVLRPGPGKGGEVTSGAVTFSLGDLRFRVLQKLVESPTPIGSVELCRRVELVTNAEVRKAEKSDEFRKKVDNARNSLAQAVWDINNRLATIPALRGRRPVQGGRNDGYHLVGVRGVVDPTPRRR